VRRIACPRTESWLLLATLVGLFGCPLLLDDNFSIGSPLAPDAGDPCIGSGCPVSYAGSGGRSGDGGAGGALGGTAGAAAGAGYGGAGAGNSGASGAAGSAGSAGAAGAGNGGSSSGTGGSGGSAGVSGSAGSGGAQATGGDAGSGGTQAAGGSAGSSGDDLACWTLELTDGTHDSSTNCLDIAGNNVIQKDTGTTLTLSYEDGDPCFTGTIAAAPDWGATYEFGFATGSGTWDADAAGVTGFEFAYRGSQQPPSVRVIYKDPGGTDNCRLITPGTTSVPFTAAHPSCSTSTSSPSVDSSQMDELILAILPNSTQSYAVDFCVQIRALD
jgi:hypothetical protein